MNIRYLIVTIIIVVTGCAHQEVEQKIQKLDSSFISKGFARIDIVTKTFTLGAWKGPQKNSRVLHIYIEGDGFAWVSRHTPSKNPTPNSMLVPKLAMLDKHVNTVYLARPCQYVDIKKRACDVRYWTKSRFSYDVIDSMNEAVTQLKEMTKAEKIVLFGYSGGGAVALLIAAHRDDISEVVTIAGNVNHKTWTDLHKISGLTDSLNPPDFQKDLLNSRQMHFIGDTDFIVPLEVYQSYRKVFPQSANIRMEILSGFDHQCCWVKAWPELLEKVQ